MNGWQLNIHPAASDEAQAASSWYRERSHDAAARFVIELNQTIDRILQAPERWQKTSSGTRSLMTPNFPYSIIYRVSENIVQVLAVAHGSRKPGFWKHRL